MLWSLADVETRLNKLTEKTFGDWEWDNRFWPTLCKREKTSLPSLLKEGYPRLDIYESDGVYYVKAAVPGLKVEDVSVTYGNGLLTISGKSQNKAEKSGKRVHLKELHMSSFERTVSIDENQYDIDNINCELVDGVLTVTIPVRAETLENQKVKKIPVKTLTKGE